MVSIVLLVQENKIKQTFKPEMVHFQNERGREKIWISV